MRPKLDWHPPSQERRKAAAPHRLELSAPNWYLDQPLVTKRRVVYTRIDQGEQGACTGFGAANTLGMSRYVQPISNQLGFRIYAGAQRYDEWAGEDYEGSSVHGAMEYLRAESDYLTASWPCTKPDELKRAIVFWSAVEVGTNWLSGMWDVDDKGFVHATGVNEGGHAYALGAYALPGVMCKTGAYRIDNSWGAGWGRGGSAWITAPEMHDLVFGQNGEAHLPIKRRYPNGLLLLEAPA